MKEENYDHYVVFIGYLHEEEVHVVKQLETIDMDRDENNPRDLTDLVVESLIKEKFCREEDNEEDNEIDE